MSDSLFRQEANDASKSKLIGSVALYCPPYRWLIISIVGFITLAIAAFFFFGSYTKREAAQGELLPLNGVMSIVPRVSGTIIDMSLHEGQRVNKGDPLATISSEVSTELGPTRENVAEQLKLQREGLQMDLNSLEELNREAMSGFKEREQLLNSQMKQLEIQYQQRTRQANLARQQMEKVQLMRGQGYASNTQVEQQETAMLDVDARLQDVSSQLIDFKQKISNLKQQIREQPLNARSQKNDIERKLSEIEQSLAENESRRSVVLRAPDNGTVGTVLVKLGQVINSGQTAISLLPENARLQARIMVSSRAIGFIRSGQKVVLRYQAFPYQKFGQQYGKVVEVSRVALSPVEVATITGNNNVKEQHYRVMVELDQQEINVYGKPEKLRPGSAVEADFLIDRRRLYEWVLEPLYALGRNSLM